MKRVNMSLVYEAGDEKTVLNKVLDLYKHWDKARDVEDELVITIHPEL